MQSKGAGRGAEPLQEAITAGIGLGFAAWSSVLVLLPGEGLGFKTHSWVYENLRRGWRMSRGVWGVSGSKSVGKVAGLAGISVMELAGEAGMWDLPEASPHTEQVLH